MSQLKLPTYRQLGRFLMFAAGALTVLLTGLYFYYSPRLNRSLTEYVLFHPPQRPEHMDKLEIAGVEGKHYSIVVPASEATHGKPVELDSVLFASHPERGVVFFSQGVGSSICRMSDPFKIESILKSGYSVFMYDQEGYGFSSGSCDIDRVVPDALAAYDFLTRDLKYEPRSVIAYGESFGGGVTSEIQKVRPLKAIILESTFLSPKRWADDMTGFTAMYPDFLFMQPAFDNLAMLKGAHPPVLLVVNEKDQTMPANHAEQMIKEAEQPFRFVSLPASKHAKVDAADRPLFFATVSAFLLKNADSPARQVSSTTKP